MFGEKKGSCEHIYGVCDNDICGNKKESCKLTALIDVYININNFNNTFSNLKANFCIMIANNHAKISRCFDDMGKMLNKC